MSHSSKIQISVLASLVLFATVCWAQKDTGNIVGTVKDKSGAVLPSSQVVVEDVDRGTTFRTTSNQDGEFNAGPLKPGRYRVIVEREGFKKTVVGPIELNIQERPSVDVVLQVGQVNEQITVNTLGPQLETQNSDIGQVVGSRRIETLPLNGRNYAQLAQLSVGVVPAEPGSREEKSFGFAANGARALQNNFLLDGIDNNSNLGDLLNETTYVIQPSVDALAEFKVQTNSYSAEFGRGNGAIMNAVIKSGTNQLHGDVYEFLRNEKFDALNAFDQFGKQPYKQNQFGFTIGGPIIKNKTFFFFDYEGLRVRQATPILQLVPTQSEAAGDFRENLQSTVAPQVDADGNVIDGSTALDCNGSPTFVGEIFDTRQTTQSGLNPNGFCGVPISSGGNLNVFSGSAIDPLAARLAAFLPAPNTTLSGSNFLTEPVRKESRNNFDIRIDHKLSQKDDFFGRFSYEDQPSTIPSTFNNVLDGGGFFDGLEGNSYRSLALSDAHLFAGNVVNELRLGYNRINSHRYQLNFDKNIAGDPSFGINFPGVPFAPLNGGLPELDFGDGTATIGSATFLPSREIQNSWVLTDNLTWVRGRHSLKFGTEIRHEQFTLFQPAASRGNMGFGGEFTDNPASPGSGGSAFASFLLGIPDFGELTSLHNVDYHRQIYSGYAQDDFRVMPRLTLNLGLRYEFFSTIKEAHDQEATFDYASQSLIVPKGQDQELTPIIGASIPIVRNGTRGLINPDRNNFAPRVGLAFQITDKLVLRSGYGIFYGGQENGPYSNPSPGFNPPFFSIESFNTNCGASSANPNGVDCSIPNLNVLANGFPANSLTDPNTPLLYSEDPNLRTPYNQQWHLGLQYQLPAQTVLEVSYAGSRGLKLFAFYNGNQAVPTADQTAAFAPRRPVHKSAAGAGPCTVATPDNCDEAFDTTISTFRSNAYSNYNSLQARLEKRLTRGLQFQASYTYAHALDIASSASLGSFASGDFRDQRFPQLEYGNADFDIRHRFIFSYSYELPFGKGKVLGGNASGVMNQIIGGWQVAGITSASTGNYFTPTDIETNLSNSDGGGTVANSARPNRIGDPNGKHCIAGTLFNTCAFTTNKVFGAFGNAGRNIIRGPGFQNWDLSLFKTFPFNERYSFEFRAEFFNVWNHLNPLLVPGKFLFDSPATDHGLDLNPGESGCPVDNLNSNCAWGFPQSARDPRFVQLALKFYF